jgi:flagellar biosynthesis GTPase FlhF
MAKLSNETSETIWSLKRQLAKVIENAKATEFVLFDTFGENERTDSYLADLQSVAEQATDRFSQLSKFGVLTPSLKSQMIC